jgi:hypothetical protein
MIVYLGNKKVNNLYSGDKEVLSPTTDAQVNFELDIEYLIVAGGGAGGFGNATGDMGNNYGAGGGAGGFISSSFQSLSRGTYPITIGNGGVATVGKGTNGSNSTFLSQTAIGGGGGGGLGGVGVVNGNNGGSGGGGARPDGVPGTGTAGQGNNGGESGNITNNRCGGGGGGAGSAAITPSIPNPRGNAGSAKGWLNGNNYCSGGGGQNAGGAPIFGNGLFGNGGDGGYEDPLPPKNGNAGVVIIRYENLQRPQYPTGGTITYADGYTYHTFTSAGNFVY